MARYGKLCLGETRSKILDCISGAWCFNSSVRIRKIFQNSLHSSEFQYHHFFKKVELALASVALLVGVWSHKLKGHTQV